MGFAATGRADHQQVVTASSGQGQAPTRQPFGLNGWRLWVLRLRSGPAHPQAGPLPLELLHQLLQIGGGAHHQVWDQSRFIGITRRHHQRLRSVAGSQLRNGDHAAARPEAAVKAQLAGAPDAVQPWAVQLATGHQQSKGNRQIKGGTLLAQIGGGQVDHHPHQRSAEAGVAQGGSHPFPGFLDRLVR